MTDAAARASSITSSPTPAASAACWIASINAGLHTTVGTWRPAVGVDVTGYVGTTMPVVTDDIPQISGDAELALQARIEPLRFTEERWTASALRLDSGAGWERARPVLAVGLTAVGLTAVGVGIRF